MRAACTWRVPSSLPRAAMLGSLFRHVQRILEVCSADWNITSPVRPSRTYTHTYGHADTQTHTHTHRAQCMRSRSFRGG